MNSDDVLKLPDIKSKDLIKGQLRRQKFNCPIREFYIYEKNHEILSDGSEYEKDETVIIVSELDSEGYAIIGNEPKDDYIKNDKKIDVFYMYFSESIVYGYAYDIKMSYCGEKEALKLIEQWESAIFLFDMFCIRHERIMHRNHIDNVKREYTIGVITEKVDMQKLKNHIDTKKSKVVEEFSDEIYINKYHAQIDLDLNREIFLLESVYNGEVELNGANGQKYKIKINIIKMNDDPSRMQSKICELSFSNGLKV